MLQIQSRAYGIALGSIGIMVNLSWFEKDEAGELHFRSVDIEGATLYENELVRKFINLTGQRFSIACLSDARFSVIAECNPEQADFFDMLANARDHKKAIGMITGVMATLESGK